MKKDRIKRSKSGERGKVFGAFRRSPKEKVQKEARKRRFWNFKKKFRRKGPKRGEKEKKFGALKRNSEKKIQKSEQEYQRIMKKERDYTERAKGPVPMAIKEAVNKGLLIDILDNLCYTITN